MPSPPPPPPLGPLHTRLTSPPPPPPRAFAHAPHLAPPPPPLSLFLSPTQAGPLAWALCVVAIELGLPHKAVYRPWLTPVWQAAVAGCALLAGALFYGPLQPAGPPPGLPSVLQPPHGHLPPAGADQVELGTSSLSEVSGSM